jgi:crotonobetainyl-CoA:carnitine CoA-transferase CaiB-like acyl-CoA transferase
MSAAPSVGEHTNEILSEILELDKEQIFAMRKSGII